MTILIQRSLCVLGAIASLVLSGCASLDEKYIPQQVGSCNEFQVEGGLQVHLHPQNDWVIKGQPITFIIELRNYSDKAIRVPKNPPLLLFWTYANGQRDNEIEDPYPISTFNEKNTMLIPPGSKMTLQKRVDTYYFPKCGITEFQVVYYPPANNNPNILPLWEQESPSNSYGIRIVKPGRTPLLSRPHSSYPGELTSWNRKA